MSKGKPNRRNLLALGAGLAAVATGWQLWLGRTQPLSFLPIQGFPGWRRIVFEGVTGSVGAATNAVFMGLDAPNAVPPFPPHLLCDALYSKVDGPGIPAAIFTDVNCPNCSSLEAKLNQRRDLLSLNWHDLPLLGATSENAARAMIAGELQPGGRAFRQKILSANPGRLMPAVLAKLADDSGLDGQRLLADMASTQIDTKLDQTLSIAKALGIWGTPGFTIGRTFVLGDIREEVLDQLIAEEAQFQGC